MKKEKKNRPLTEEEQIFAKSLIDKYDKTIRRTVQANLYDEVGEDFEDVVQNVYEMICRQLDDFRSYKEPEALAYTIAARAARNRSRAYKETLPLTEDPPGRERDPGLGELLPEDLPERDRELLTAVYERRDTVAETARDHGEKPAAVRQRLKRVRDRMKVMLFGEI